MNRTKTGHINIHNHKYFPREDSDRRFIKSRRSWHLVISDRHRTARKARKIREKETGLRTVESSKANVKRNLSPTLLTQNQFKLKLFLLVLLFDKSKRKRRWSRVRNVDERDSEGKESYWGHGSHKANVACPTFCQLCRGLRGAPSLRPQGHTCHSRPGSTSRPRAHCLELSREACATGWYDHLFQM